MTQHAPVLIVLLPLTASLLCMLLSRISRNLGSVVKPGIIGWVAGSRQSALNLPWIR